MPGLPNAGVPDTPGGDVHGFGCQHVDDAALGVQLPQDARIKLTLAVHGQAGSAAPSASSFSGNAGVIMVLWSLNSFHLRWPQGTRTVTAAPRIRGWSLPRQTVCSHMYI